MINWEYVILVNVLIALSFMFHELVLRKTTFFQITRVYWITAVLLAFIVPNITFLSVEQSLSSALPSIVINLDNSSPQQITVSDSKPWFQQINWFITIYLFGLSIAVVRKVKAIYNFARLVKHARKTLVSENEIYVTPQLSSSCSFGGRIFIHEKDFENEARVLSILRHEQVHLQEKHHWDNALFVLLQCVLWFNPFVYLLVKRAQLNHEYIADRATINSGISAKNYTNMLLGAALGAPSFSFIHTFVKTNTLKNRFKMIAIKQSHPTQLFRLLLIIPLLASFVMLTACAQQDTEEIINNDHVLKTADVMPEFPGGQQEMMKFIGSHVSFPKDLEETMSCTVFVQFAVEADGNVGKVEMVKTKADVANEKDIAKFEESVLNMLAQMPKWTPGQKDGENVAVFMTLPVKFQKPNSEKEGVKLNSTQFYNHIISASGLRDLTNGKDQFDLKYTVHPDGHGEIKNFWLTNTKLSSSQKQEYLEKLQTAALTAPRIEGAEKLTEPITNVMHEDQF